MKKMKTKVIVIFLVFIINTIIIFMNSGKIIKFIVSLIPDEIQIIAMRPTEIFGISLQLSMLLSFIILLPIFVYYLFVFLSDVLYKHEKLMLKKVLFIGTLLFLFGFVLSFVAFVKGALPWFSQFNATYGIETIWSLTETINSILLLSFVSGAIFEFPIVMYFLIKYRIMDFKMEYKTRVLSLLTLLIVFAMITPDGSMITQIILTIPVYLLLELSSHFGNKNKLREVKK